jgi:hypothetical protein
MKRIITILVCLLSLQSFAQTIKTSIGVQTYTLGEATRVVTLKDGTKFTVVGSYAKAAVQAAYNKLKPTPIPTDLVNHFTFTLDKKSTTSAGVYIKGTNKLVKELWAAVDFDKGIHTDTWDRKDGLGKQVAEGKYEVRVLSHNIVPNWKGVMANTSRDQIGDNRHKPLDPIIGIRGFMHPITKKWCYLYNSGYGEGGQATAMFYADEPQVRFNPLTIHGTNQNTDITCSNATKIFYIGYDPLDNEAESFAYATDLSGANLINFPKGVKAKMDWGIEYTSVIGYIKQPVKGSANITGADCNDKYLFLARANMNRISVIDAETGGLLLDVAVNNPGALHVVGNDLWTGNGTSVTKRPINANGSLGTPTLTIPGFSNVLDINSFGANITIVDGGTSQQIKTYNHTTGAHQWTRGKLGGLMGIGSKVVTEQTYLFNKQTSNGDGKNSEFSSIAFGPKGDYWLCDPGNRRVLHFQADGTYIDQIASESRSYNVRVNPNDPTLVMAGFRVFKVDWSNPDVTKNWKLLWNFQEYGGDIYTDFDGFTTLPNGKMYATRREVVEGRQTIRVVELDPAKGVRRTKCTIPFGMPSMYEDGSIRWINEVAGGPRGKQEFWKRDLKGFDADSDPIWGDEYKENEVVTPKEGPKAGLPFSNRHSKRTKNGNIILFEGGISSEDAPGQFRLGGLAKDGFAFQTMATVEKNHRGAFPTDGKFDYANYERKPDNSPWNGYFSSDILTLEEIIATFFHGEFWKGGGQTNKCSLFHQDGLFLTTFGYERAGGDQRKGQPYQAGNAITPNLFKIGDRIFWVHGDESGHQGIHVVEIEGWNTVRIQVALPSATGPIVLPGIDLLADFKRGDVVTGSKGRWTIPNTHNTDGNDRFVGLVGGMSTSNYWREGVDLRFEFAMPSGGRREVVCDLGTNVGLSSWALRGLVEFDRNERNDPSGQVGHLIEVLDDAGKVIAEFKYQREPDVFGKTTFRGNGAVMATFNEEDSNPKVAQEATVQMTKTKFYQPLSISSVGGMVRIQYADFGSVNVPVKDTGANIGAPRSLRVKFFTEGNVYSKAVGFYQLRFFDK